MPHSSKSERLQLAAFLVLYGACLAWLMPTLSLWLDEILDLIGARYPNLPWMFDYIRGNAGGVPAGYLAQRLSMGVFGVSAFAGRLPSALASLAGCVGIFVLAKRTGLKWPLLAVAFFAICPLQLRYAVEARGYSLALCATIWATVAFCSRRFVLYGLAVVVGLYTLPLSIFVPAAHWLSAFRRERREWLQMSAAIVAALICFLPWYFYASGWTHSVAGVQGRYMPDFRSLSLILRELAGMGYIGTGLVLASAIWGLANRGQKLFWVLYLVIPIAGALLADMRFGYFLSIRQMIFVLAPLSVLFAQGVEALAERDWRAGMMLAAAVLIVALVAGVGYFQRPREDWKSASAALAEETGKGVCIVFVPGDSESLYTFFRPELANAKCGAELHNGNVAVAVSPYGADTTRIEARLLDQNFKQSRTLTRPEPKIVIFSRTD